MGAGRLFLGAAIAVAAGAFLGMLFAPDRESSTWKRLSNQGYQSLDALEPAGGDYVDPFEESFGEVFENAAGISGELEGAADAFSRHQPPEYTHQG